MGKLKDSVRPRAQQKVDNLVGPLYVRPEHLDAAVAEITRMMTENVDAQAEVAAMIGVRIATLEASVELLQEEVRALRAEVESR